MLQDMGGPRYEGGVIDDDAALVDRRRGPRGAVRARTGRHGLPDESDHHEDGERDDCVDDLRAAAHDSSRPDGDGSPP